MSDNLFSHSPLESINSSHSLLNQLVDNRVRVNFVRFLDLTVDNKSRYLWQVNDTFNEASVLLVNVQNLKVNGLSPVEVDEVISADQSITLIYNFTSTGDSINWTSGLVNVNFDSNYSLRPESGTTI